MLKIVDRYLIAEVLKTFLAIVFVLILIVSSMLFLRTLEEISLGALNAGLLLRFLGLQVLRDASSLLPPAFFIAALAALGRLAKDSELVALNACGVGPGRVYRALLILAIPVAGFTGWLSLNVQPWAAAGIAEIRLQQREQAVQIAGLQAGRFYSEAKGDLVVYIGAIDKERGLERIFILDRREEKMRTVVADTGHYQREEHTEDHLITLVDGHRFDGNPGSGDFLISKYGEYQIRIRDNDEEQHKFTKRSTTPSAVLLRSDDLQDRTELEHRIGAPLAVLVLTLISVPLVTISPRQRTSGRLSIAFLAYFAFFNLQRLAESWLAGGVTPMWLTSLWYQVLILAAVYLLLAPDSVWYKRMREHIGGRTEPTPESS